MREQRTSRKGVSTNGTLATSRLRFFGAAVIATLWVAFSGGAGRVAYATHGEPHATITTWAVGADATIRGFDPHETVEDVAGLNNHVGAPAMVSFMENTGGGFCGILYWNPDTNFFVSYALFGGFNFAGDLNRGAPAPAGSPPGTYGGGDAWSAVHGNSSDSPYMNFRGSDIIRTWNLGASSSTGIRVNSANGKVYMGNSSTPGELIELDPATNMVKKWSTGSMPYNLVVAGTVIFATGTAGSGQPDQILRLNPATNELTRWNVPGGGFTACCPFGTPDSITVDLEGNVWFTESTSNEVGRLHPTTNVIDEYTKAGVDTPHAIATSGTGASLQAFFTEASGSISVLTVADATPTTMVVTPTVETLMPTTSMVTPTEFTHTPATSTITPSTSDSPGLDPSGIVRFPIPAGTAEPTGMTRVAFPQTVFGSMEGSDDVFRLVSEAIVAPPAGDPFGGLVRTSSRRVRLTVIRPSSEALSTRCTETDPASPDYDAIPFTPFPDGEVDVTVVLSPGDGLKTVCCEFMTATGSFSSCGLVLLEQPPAAAAPAMSWTVLGLTILLLLAFVRFRLRSPA